MASLTLSLTLAGGDLQVCYPGDDPPEIPEEAAAEGEDACGEGAPASVERGLPPPTLPPVAIVPEIPH